MLWKIYCKKTNETHELYLHNFVHTIFTRLHLVICPNIRKRNKIRSKNKENHILWNGILYMYLLRIFISKRSSGLSVLLSSAYNSIKILTITYDMYLLSPCVYYFSTSILIKLGEKEKREKTSFIAFWQLWD